MELETSAGKILKRGSNIALLIIVIGIIVGIITGFQDGGIWFTIVSIGILAIILVPFIGIPVAIYCLNYINDKYWMKVAILLFSISITGMVVAYLS